MIYPFPISGGLNDPSCLAHIFGNDAPVGVVFTALMTGPAGRAIVVGTLLVTPHGMRNLLDLVASVAFITWPRQLGKAGWADPLTILDPQSTDTYRVPAEGRSTNHFG